MKKYIVLFLVSVLVHSVVIAQNRFVIDELEGVVLSTAIKPYFLVIDDDNHIHVYGNDHKLHEITGEEDIVGIDYADVVGDFHKDLIIVGKHDISALDLHSRPIGRQTLFSNQTIFSRINLENSPRRLKLFFQFSQYEKAQALYFMDEGLYLQESENRRIVFDDSPPSYLDLFGTQLTLPSVQSISSAVPLLSVHDANGDGRDEIVYMNRGKIVIITPDTGESTVIDIDPYYEIPGSVFWAAAPVAFVDENGDGILDMHLFTFTDTGGRNNGFSTLNLRVQVFRGMDKENLSFQSFPSSSYAVLETSFPNGLCTLNDVNGDGQVDLEFISIDLAATLGNVLLRRSISVNYTPILFSESDRRYKEPGDSVQSQLSLDADSSTDDAAASSLDVIVSIDFNSVMGGLFTSQRSPGGESGSDVFMYNRRMRKIIRSTLPGSSRTERLRTPSFLRSSDQPVLIPDGNLLHVYMFRNDQLYYGSVKL